MLIKSNAATSGAVPGALWLRWCRASPGPCGCGGGATAIALQVHHAEDIKPVQPLFSETRVLELPGPCRERWLTRVMAGGSNALDDIPPVPRGPRLASLRRAESSAVTRGHYGESDTTPHVLQC